MAFQAAVMLAGIPGEKNNPGFLNLRIFGMGEGKNTRRVTLNSKEFLVTSTKLKLQGWFQGYCLRIRTLNNSEGGETLTGFAVLMVTLEVGTLGEHRGF
jgi:hypothetical protein